MRYVRETASRLLSAILVTPPAVCILAAGLLSGFWCCLGAVASDSVGTTSAGRRGEFVAFAQSSNSVAVLDGESDYLELNFIGWGPNWQYLGFRPRRSVKLAEVCLMSSEATVSASGAKVRYELAVRGVAPRLLQLATTLQSDQDTPITCIVLAVRFDPGQFAGGYFLVDEAGRERPVKYPLVRQGLGRRVRRFVAVDCHGRRTRFEFEPARDVPTDGEARIVLAQGRLRQVERQRATIKIELPGTVQFWPDPSQLPSDSELADWYPFRPTNDTSSPSVLDMSDWNEKLAGSHGRIRCDGDRLLCGGRPVKLWGINVCYSSCSPPKELAERRAKFYAKYGIDSVRLHKFADGSGWAGIQSADSAVKFDPDGLDRMDYFVAKLKEAGIYVSLSAHFGTIKIGPADLQLVPYANEFGQFHGRREWIEAPASAFFYSPELQELHIRQITNLLRHRNPYTGLSYAADPAVAFVEIINEQGVLFYTSMEPLRRSKTLRRLVAKRFCDWLRRRYGTHQALVAAWGERALDSFAGEGFRVSGGERLESNNILPLGNPWFWDPEQLAGAQAFRRRRLLDTLQFLYELQCQAYDRYVKAVRAAGYEGELIGSKWQAGRAFSHYYNLHPDYRVGL